MNQRDLILAAWQRRKATRAPSPHVQMAGEFFDLIESHPDICWDELSAAFRQSYYEAFDEIVPTLLSTDDPLIIHNCIRFADLTNPKEAEAAKTLIQQVDPDKHEVSMLALAADDGLRPTIKNKKQLPDSVKAALSAKGKQ
jgi:hypothetical protein